LKALLVAALIVGPGAAHAAQNIPLPRPRPFEAGQRPLLASPPAPALPTTVPAVQTAAEPEEASACRIRLSADIAVAPSIDPLTGPGGCGAPDAVRLEAVFLKDSTRVPVSPPAQMRCSMAEAVVSWVREELAPLAVQQIGSALRGIDNFDSYSCRGRNRVPGAQLSEHGRANALDIRSVKLANGKSYELTDREVPRPFREALRTSACENFTTVLGPGSDGYHENHVHIDLMQRRNGYRICQWDIKDAAPDIPLPRPRPKMDEEDMDDGHHAP